MNAIKIIFTDIFAGLKQWQVWWMLAWQDIRIRYKRSILGPFWITISMAITVYAMGFLYGHLFNMDLQRYFPYLASGMIIWALVATILNEAPNIFIEGAAFIKQVKLPYSVFIYRTIMRNLIIFGHNIIAIIPLWIYFKVPVNFSLFLALIGLMILLIAGYIYAFLLAMIGSRYRDIAPIIVSMVQVTFFLSPILWMSDRIPLRFQFIVSYNPAAQFINLVRQPLLGQWPSWHSYLAALIVIVVGLALTVSLYKRSYKRIVFWL